jgi:CBS domain-containing protein
MGLLRSCDQLRREHDVIARVVAGVDDLARRRRRGGDVPALPITGAIDFFSGFVTAFHEVKEHEGLFPALAAHDIVDAGVMNALRADHDEGRRLLGALRPLSSRRRIDGEAWSALEAYLGLLQRHIATEDTTLFPLAERTLTTDDDATVERAFARVEERALGRGGSQALLALADAVVHASGVAGAAVRGGAAELVARDVMRARPSTVAPDDSLARAADLMKSVRTRELPVIADDRLVGVLTRTDMDPYRGHWEWTAVRAAMTPDPVVIAPEMPVPAVARLLLARGFNALPVTEGGRLVGLVCRADVLRAVAGTTDR